MNERVVPSLSFVLVAIVSGFCLVQFHLKKELHEEIDFDFEFPYVTFMIPAFYAILGAVIYIRNIASYRVWTALYKAEVFLKTVSFPFFATEIWLKYGVIQPEIAWIHAIVGGIPAVMFLCDAHFKESWIDLAVYLNTLSLVIVCSQHKNFWGLASVIAFVTGYYTQRKFLRFINIEPLVLFNFLVAVYNLCALFALTTKSVDELTTINS